MELGLLRGTVRLCPHDTAWEQAAAYTVDLLKTLFGSAAVDVQHVGSTSIRHIAAKPILDIAVAVQDFAALTPLEPTLSAHGFIRRPHCDDEGQRFLVCGDFARDTRTHHIHVVLADGKEWRDYRNFRDFLNARPVEAQAYEQVKRALAAQFPHDREAYTAGKAAHITRTLVRARAWAYLGKTVTVQIDRPIGYVHQKPDYSLTYPINYGYLPGVIGGDGEELDAYVLGVDTPLAAFTGRVIGVVCRENDVEDKLVVAPEGARFNQADIAETVRFQEQYYHTRIEPLYHRSCGVIAYRYRGGTCQYLLLQERGAGTWGFPKGHMEAGETEREAAIREAQEEAGFIPTLRAGFCEEITYAMPTVGEKTVTFFLAEYEGDITPRPAEIAAYRWMEKDAAKQALHHRELGAVLEKAEAWISGQ